MANAALIIQNGLFVFSLSIKGGHAWPGPRLREVRKLDSDCVEIAKIESHPFLKSLFKRSAIPVSFSLSQKEPLQQKNRQSQ